MSAQASLTALEQYFLELVNYARLEPLDEAEAHGIGLNDGLPEGTFRGTPMQPLAGNAALSAASESHAAWMITSDAIGHDGEGGSTPVSRIEGAGYVLAGDWSWAETLGWWGTTEPLDPDAAGPDAVETIHSHLFLSAPHRAAMLDPGFRETGVGLAFGDLTVGGTTYSSAMGVQTFARSGDHVFLTGVAYDDGDADGFYTPGEGRGGITFSVEGSAAETAAAGGYSLALSQGLQTVTVTGGGTTSVVRVDLGAGNVKLDLVDGNILLSSGHLTLVSGVSDAALIGAGDLNLVGTAAGNWLGGNRGENQIVAGAGNDVVLAADGHDRVWGQDGADRIDLGLGNDTGVGGTGSDTILGGDGDDQLRGEGQDDLLDGDLGDDILDAGAGDDIIEAGQGNDIGYGWSGADTIRGGAGNDTLHGGTEADQIDGGEGDDRLVGGAGDDTLLGGDGADSISAHDGLNEVRAGSGNDVVAGGAAQDRLWGDDGDDNLHGGDGNDIIYGGAGGDTLNGGLGIDLMEGGAGNDLLRGLDGADSLRGGEGADRAFGGEGGDDIAAGAGNDLVYGEGGTDILRGDEGADTVLGGMGDDWIEGGSGDDRLSGEGGADTFVFGRGGGNDRVLDFAAAADRLQFDAALWGEAPLSALDVVGGFARLSGADVIFDFGAGDTLSLLGLGSLAGLDEAIMIA